MTLVKKKTFKKAIIFTLTLLLPLLAASCSFSEELKEIKMIKTEKHQSFSNLPLYILLEQDFNFKKTNSGYADKEKKIALETIELQLSYKTLLEEFNEENLKKAGLELKSQVNLLWNGSNATLLKVFQTDINSVTGKWILIIDQGEKTWMLNSSYDSKNQQHSSSLLKMIKSVFWINADSSNGISASAPIGRISTNETEIKFAGSSQGALVYTKDGNLPTKSPDGSLFVISNKKKPSAISSNKYLPYAKEKIKSIEPNQEVNIVSENDVAIDGLPGIQLIGSTKEEQGLIFMTLLFDDDNIHTFVGIAKKNTAKNLELFHSLCSTYKKDA